MDTCNNQVKISFGEDHSPIQLPKGAILSEKLNRLNSPLLFGCRTGICGTCLVRVLEHARPLDPPGEDEKEVLACLEVSDPNVRLACCLRAEGDLTVIPEDGYES